MGNQHTVQMSTLQNASTAFGSGTTVLTRNQHQLPKLQLSKINMSMSNPSQSGNNNSRIQVNHELGFNFPGLSQNQRAKVSLNAISRRNSDISESAHTRH